MIVMLPKSTRNTNFVVGNVVRQMRSFELKMPKIPPLMVLTTLPRVDPVVGWLGGHPGIPHPSTPSTSVRLLPRYQKHKVGAYALMVSVGIPKLGCTDLIFVDPGVKINSAYYRDVLLSKQLLPVMREVSGEFFVFQQDNAPAHRHPTLCDFSSNAGVHSTGSLASEQP